jgi:lipopolysaccharide transport system ATP-binding protein
MRKKEVALKFDEIVAFSGVEEFIDTPVKRYSSGMYVRLAFAIAAHLEPEILIVDEVLAVGDAEFKKKCLGKMDQVSKSGRTILFVSHEMSAITSLCTRGVLMSAGKVLAQGSAAAMVNEYMMDIAKMSTAKAWEDHERPGDEYIRLNSVRLVNESLKGVSMVAIDEKFGVEIVYEILKSGTRINPCISAYISGGILLLTSLPESRHIRTEKGIHKAYCWFPPMLLNSGLISLRVNAHTFYPNHVHFDLLDLIQFEVVEAINPDIRTDYKDKLLGATRAVLDWNVI